MNPSIKTHLLASATALALVGMAAPPANAGEVHLSGLQDAPTHTRFIVRYREGSQRRTDVAAARAQFNRAGMLLAKGNVLTLEHERRLGVGADVISTSRPLDRDAAERLMRRLAADPAVEYVEVDRMMRAQAIPNDSYYDSQWHYHATDTGLNLPPAWEKSTGDGVVVAVIDTGILPHDDLAANVTGGYDFISYYGGGTGGSNDGNGRDANPYDSSFGQHGTHVAGTIAAVTNNGIGVAGVAPDAKIVPLRVLGNGSWGSTSDIADAIVWAAGGHVPGVPDNANPAEVINLSLGGGGACGSTYQSAINSAVNNGATVIIAAGNNNGDVANFTPANCDYVVAVAASDYYGNRASYSNYGARIDVTAPGGETYYNGQGVLSTVGNGNYAWYQGTSMATPHVAGVAALMQAAASTPLTPAQVEEALETSARPMPGACNYGCGAGLVDANAAVDAALGEQTPPDNVLENGVPVTGLSAYGGTALRYTLKVPAGASGLQFEISGRNGDADLYVNYDAPAGGRNYVCKSTSPDSTETCRIPSASAGTYHVLVWAYYGFSGLSLTGSYNQGGGGVQTYANEADVTIYDHYTVQSAIDVSGRNGNAPANAEIAVDIRHSYRGDVKVQLIAPDGSAYLLKDYNSNDSADGVKLSRMLDLSGEPLNGRWMLHVSDNWNNDTGYINRWSITF